MKPKKAKPKEFEKFFLNNILENERDKRFIGVLAIIRAENISRMSVFNHPQAIEHFSKLNLIEEEIFNNKYKNQHCKSVKEVDVALDSTIDYYSKRTNRHMAAIKVKASN